MYEYMTRHMVALREFNYGDATVKPGEPFLATPDDVGYLTRAGKAREGQPQITIKQSFFAERAEPVVESVVSSEAPGDPPVEAEVAPIEAEDALIEDAPTAESDDAEEVVPATRRRGRPRKSA